jgi:chromosome segregation protein
MSGVVGRKGEIEGRLSATKRNLESLMEEAGQIASEIDSAERERQEFEEEVYELSLTAERAAEAVERLALDLEKAQEEGQNATLDVNSITERLVTAEREAGRIMEWLRDIEGQIAVKERELEESFHDIERLTQRREAVLAELSGDTERLDAAQKDVDAQRQMVDQARAVLNERENQARRLRRHRTELDEAIRKLELDLQEVHFQRQRLAERMEEEYQMSLDRLSMDRRQDPEQEMDIEAGRRRRQELWKKIQSMGEVNLTAIGEHEALMERYTFYKDQFDDLTGAIQNLKNSISKINRTCKIRFKSTYEAVDAKLREIFPLLFEGGEAWLSLTDEHDILDSGVEIHVHPPGKKLTVMSLLSGGEKALVALALIFALYLIKPSPFCLLDETDAPLDEANIDRFNRLLKKLGQSSQIIMVTHNKRTMQIAQTLYGVTMETPGISKMVSVNLSDVEDLEDHAQMVQAR